MCVVGEGGLCVLPFCEEYLCTDIGTFGFEKEIGIFQVPGLVLVLVAAVLALAGVLLTACSTAGRGLRDEGSRRSCSGSLP